MRTFRFLVQAASLASLLAGPTLASVVRPRSTGLPPSQDPWYTAPDGYEQAAPGDVLRMRDDPNGFVAALGENATAAYNILFRTTDVFGQPSWAVTTVVVPTTSSSSASEGHSALLSYQIPYNSDNIDNSPSYTLISQFGVLLVDVLDPLANGWYVNIPDFEGPKAAFSVALESAYVTMDSIRAALTAVEGLCKSSTRVALWGYSGGSLPSEVAAEILPDYAPDLNVVGVALGGLLPNITNSIGLVNEQGYAGIAPLVVLGLAARYPEVQSYLERELKPSGPYNKTTFLACATMETFQVYGIFANQSVGDYFLNGNDWLRAPELQPAITTNWIQGIHATPLVPLFFYKATGDEFGYIDTDNLVAQYCADGANILYERNLLGNHLEEETNGRPAAFAWLTAVLEGTYATQYDTVGCTIQDVSIDIAQST